MSASADAQPPRRRGRPRRTASTRSSATTAPCWPTSSTPCATSGLAIYAEPVEGFPPHHYAQKHPLPPGAGDVLYVTRGGTGPACRAPRPPCAGGRPLAAGARASSPARSSPSACPARCWFPGSPGRADPIGPARPPPEPDPQRPAGRLDLLDPLLPRVGGARLARHRAAAHRLRALRQQGGGQPRLYPRLARGARLHLRRSRCWSAASAGAGPTPSAPRSSASTRRCSRSTRRRRSSSACSAAPPGRRCSTSRSALYIMDNIGKRELTRSEPLRLAVATLAWGVAPYVGVRLMQAVGLWAPCGRSASRAVVLLLAGLLGAAARRGRPDPRRRAARRRSRTRSPRSAASPRSRGCASPGRSPSPARPSGPPSSSTCRS